jgi:hypothetical protein
MTAVATSTEALIHLLETAPEQFLAVARQTKLLPGIVQARDYTNAELEQLNNGLVRMLLEELRDEPRAFRSTFMEVAIPSFIHAGETTASMVQWNAGYLVLLGAALATALPNQHRAATTRWFAGFAGAYMRELLEATLEASRALRASAA